MRFLVHASGDRMFGFLREGGRASWRTSLTASARAALLDALALPVKTLDACASPLLVATAHQAAVAVAPVGPRRVAQEPRVVKGGCALWVTLAMLGGVKCADVYMNRYKLLS
eukprot:5385780-Pleurochrysis_carterae.AAC.1